MIMMRKRVRDIEGERERAWRKYESTKLSLLNGTFTLWDFSWNRIFQHPVRWRAVIVELLYTAPRHIYTQFTISLNDESQDDDDDVEIEFMDGNEGDGKIFNQIHEIQNNGKLNVFEKFK